MSKNASLFAASVRELMQKARWGQSKLAEQAGITQASVSAYLSGKTAPSLDAAAAIAKAFGVSIDVLLGNATPTPHVIEHTPQECAKIALECLANQTATVLPIRSKELPCMPDDILGRLQKLTNIEDLIHLDQAIITLINQRERAAERARLAAKAADKKA